MTLRQTTKKTVKTTWVVYPLFVLILCSHAQAPQTIQLTVDYNDGIQKRFTLVFKEGMTVFDAMIAAKASPHGLTFECEPKYPCDAPPAKRILSTIDDLKNQGYDPSPDDNQRDGSSAKNWAFWVNDVYADKGFGICKLGPDDKILWRFDEFGGEKPGKACR